MINKRYLTIVRITLVSVIVLESVLTAVEAVRSPTVSTLGSILPWVAAVEAMAATLVLFRRTAIVGGILLLLTFAFLLVIHGPADQLFLFVYGIVVLMLMSESRRSMDH